MNPWNLYSLVGNKPPPGSRSAVRRGRGSRKRIVTEAEEKHYARNCVEGAKSKTRALEVCAAPELISRGALASSGNNTATSTLRRVHSKTVRQTRGSARLALLCNSARHIVSRLDLRLVYLKIATSLTIHVLPERTMMATKNTSNQTCNPHYTLAIGNSAICNFAAAYGTNLTLSFVLPSTVTFAGVTAAVPCTTGQSISYASTQMMVGGPSAAQTSFGRASCSGRTRSTSSVSGSMA